MIGVLVAPGSRMQRKAVNAHIVVLTFTKNVRVGQPAASFFEQADLRAQAGKSPFQERGPALFRASPRVCYKVWGVLTATTTLLPYFLHAGTP